MSRSNPYFTNSRANYKKQMVTILDDIAFTSLHWTEQLKLRPMRTWPHPTYNRDGDFDTRVDCWDDNEILDMKEIT